MNNKQKYQRAFSALQSSQVIHLEESSMKKTYKPNLRPILAAAAAVILLISLATAAYAADLGGIRTTIQSWFQGKNATMDVVEKNPGQYEFQVHQDGQTHTMSGGGMAFDMFGNEIPLPPEDVAQTIAEQILVKEDGSIWLYYKSYAIDITQYMTEDGCKLLLNDNGEKLYYNVTPPEYNSCGYSRCPGEPDWGEDPEDYIPIN